MGQLFAFSFDEASPSAQWDTFTGTIVPGRTLNGVHISNTQKLEKVFGGTSPVWYNGVAWASDAWGGAVVFSNPTVIEGCQIQLLNVGDGRFYVKFSAIGDALTLVPVPINQGEYFYPEFSSTILGNVAGSPKVLTISASWELRINNVSIATGSFSHNGATSRPLGVQADIQFDTLTYTLQGVIDDGYLRDDMFVGDSTVSPTEVVTQVFPIDARMCQIGLEVIEQPADSVRMCQFGLEVIISTALGLVCPSSVAALSTPYSSAFIALNGNAPLTFAITAGSLPPGLTLNASTGAVTGTPITTGTYPYTGQVTDADGCIATADCSITVGGFAGLCKSVSPSPETDVYFELQRVYTTMKPAPRIPVRGS